MAKVLYHVFMIQFLYDFNLLLGQSLENLVVLVKEDLDGYLLSGLLVRGKVNLGLLTLAEFL